MKRPVVVIGLDSADPILLEKWMAEGHLKNLRRLWEQGSYSHLKNIDYYRAETPWTTFLTGCSPQKTGYWSPVKFYENTYNAKEIEAYDFTEYPPFYALGEDYRVAVFDMPQSGLSERANGIQVLAWGAHSPMTPTHSRPAHILDELTSKHGNHPVLRKDNADCLDLEALKQLQNALKIGIARRSAICQDLLQREDWDLFLTIFGETHTAGHYMWHLSQPSHPLYNVLGVQCPQDPMLEVFEAIDTAVGEILAKAPQDAYCIVFSAHGMADNVMDLPSMVFLPELLYRFSFPGHFALAKGEAGATLPPPISQKKDDGGWLGQIWDTKYDSNPVKRFLRKKLPYKAFKQFQPLFKEPDLIPYFELQKQSDPLYFQPAVWYRSLWPRMKAFALPSYSEGYIRINLQGREAQGIVPPSEYDAVCDELTKLLYELKDARTGQPMVQRVIRTRQCATDTDPKLPDADLVAIWQDENATDTVDSPTLGRIGPIPHNRTGSHRARGFFMVQGPGIAPGSSLPVGHALDLAPTILDLMEAPIPKYCEGKSLMSRTKAVSAV